MLKVTAKILMKLRTTATIVGLDYVPPIPDPLSVEITSPLENSEFEEGQDITVEYTILNGDEITDVALEIDGVEVQRKAGIFDAFLISGLDASSHSIVLKAYNGGELVATSNIVNIVVEALPLILTIATPEEGQIFTEGDNMTVSFSFDRQAPEVTKTELWINGTLSQTDSTPPFPASFVVTDLPAGAMTVEVLAFEGSTEIASDTVNVVVESGFIYEAETIAYMNALAIPDDSNASPYTGLTNNQLWNVVNDRFLSYKANGLMSLIQAEYWMVGGTAARHSYNAMNPSNFQMTWYGGWVHDALGAKGNGTNTYGDTGFSVSAHLTNTNNGCSVVSGLNNAVESDIDAGSFSGSGGLVIAVRPNKLVANINSTIQEAGVTSTIGICTVQRKDTDSFFYKDGTFLKKNSGAGNLSGVSMYLGTFNDSGTPYSIKTAKRYQGFAMHSVLTDTQVTAWHNAISTFETALGRKTW